MRFLVINGPNLNLLGTREPHLYGSDTLAGLETVWRRHVTRIGASITTFQSNHEGAIIDTIHTDAPRHDGIVINPGALSHYSYAIYDALVAVGVPTVEIHISNIEGREPWRRTSVTAPAAMRTIYGRGTDGYLDAINLLFTSLTAPSEPYSYGDDPDQVIDVRYPKSASRGVVGLLHGGFWHTPWGRDLMDPLAVALTSRGWTTANIEYRRGPGSFETSTADVEDAIAWMRTNVDGAAAPWIVGHSAGGYLALHQAQTQHDLAGVIALGSVIDLVGISEIRGDDDPVAEYLGGSPTDAPQRWSAAALDGEVAAPVWLIHGNDDAVTPLSHAVAFATSHGRAELVALGGVGHMEVIDPYEEAFSSIVSVLEPESRSGTETTIPA